MEASLLVVVERDRGAVPLEELREELARLCRTAGYAVAGVALVRQRGPRPGPFGDGVVARLAEQARELAVERVVLGLDMPVGQQRRLETACEVPVLDRTGLILDIFARHAVSAAGKLQVELARASYHYSRLTGRGTSMSRLGGGVGTRGPGEMKLEQDRRLVRARIGRLRRRLEALESQRRRARARQRRRGLSEVVLVGYTNAGKSSLLNALCGSRQAAAADRLFATLDPTTRRVHLGAARLALFTDTVGFLRDLPHELIAAFHATLEGLVEAELLLVVLDGAVRDVEEQYRIVRGVLAVVAADRVPVLPVLNKSDRLDAAGRSRLLRRLPGARPVSCLTGDGLAELKQEIARRLFPGTPPLPSPGDDK